MRKPRFLNAEEEFRLSSRPPAPEPNLEELIPFDSVQISEGCMDLAEGIGPIAEEVIGVAHEFYSEGFTRRGERPILDLYLPMQDLTSPTYFEPTPQMILEFENYRGSLGDDWITIASIHGHGRAQVIGQERVTFSLPDVERHMRNFLEGSSTPTRRIVEQLGDLSLMFNNFETEKKGGDLVVSDGFVYHPVLQMMGLPKEEQDMVLKNLGIDPAAFGDKTTLDVIAAHLEHAATLAQKKGDYALSAKQWKVLRYNYFVVFDNDRDYHAEIGILVEDTGSGRRRLARKQVELERVVVKNDVKYSDKWLRERIKIVYAAQIAQLERQKNVTVGANGFNGFPASQYESGGIVCDVKFNKVPFDGKITHKEVAHQFYYSVLKYLSLGRYEDHNYSQMLSDLFNQYVTIENSVVPFTTRFNSVASLGRDVRLVFLNQEFDHSKTRIVEGIVEGLNQSRNKGQELQFMIDFAYAPTVQAQNGVIEKYIPLFRKQNPLK
ncbi:MAG: hypothetical protein ABIJ08_01370 [Nanoarchaeota archaeon]